MIAQRRLCLFLGLMLAGALAGCARSYPPAPVQTGAPAAAGMRPAVPHPDRITVERGDTLYGIARRYDVPLRSLIDANGLTPPYKLAAGRVLTLPQLRQHVVQPGENIEGVARQHGVDASTLARTNGLSPPYTLPVGQPLTLPAPVQAAPAPPPRTLPLVVYAVAPGRSQAPTSHPAAPPPAPPVAASEPTVIAAAPKPAPVESVPLAPPPAPAAAMAAPPLSPPPPPAAPPAAPLPAAPPHEEVAALPPPLPAPHGNVRSFLWPVRGHVIAAYGAGEGGAHNDGINIAAPQGTPVVAADAGTVAYAGNELRGYGNLVLIKHADGWMTAYAHNSALLVKRGEKVARGQTIARVGATGAVGEPQLHFEIRHGTKALDPAEYLPMPAATAAKG